MADQNAIRPKLKTAVVVIFTIRLICPHCYELIECENGSEFFAQEDYESLDRTITCMHCREKFRKPTVRF